MGSQYRCKKHPSTGLGYLGLFPTPLSQHSEKDWITGCYADFGTTSTLEGGINSPLKLHPVHAFNKAFNKTLMGSEKKWEKKYFE